MRNPILVGGVMMVLGCGGGSTATGPVDPASSDFCLAWANGICRLAYTCVDTPAQGATFHARYGASMDTCFQAIEKLCTSNQTGNQTFGPSCGPGKTVDKAASTTCIDDLFSESCVAWTAAPAGGCEGVCGGASHPDAGSGSDTGVGKDAGTGTDAGTGSVATSTAYCNTEGNLTCDRSFECDPAGSAAQFGNLAGCKALFSSLCASGELCPNGYNPTLGSACLAATMAATCQALMGPQPAVCAQACP